MTELYIEGRPLDLTESISALLNFAIDDVRDFGARNTTWSKTIVLPGTANNNNVLGFIFEVQTSNPYDAALPNSLTNFNASKSARAVIFQDNIQVFKGVIRLLEVVIDGGRKEYEVAAFGELGGLVSALGNKRLQDLDFSAYNVVWNAANIVASWDNAGGSGVYFPVIDYGGYSTDKHSWDFRTLRPALYAKEYIDKIMAGAGYTYQCTLFNTARFKSLIIPHNQQTLRGQSSRIITATETAVTTIIDSTVGTTLSSVPWGSYMAGAFTYAAGVFTYTDAATLNNTTLSISLTGQRQSDTPGSFTISIRKNGVVLTSQTFTTPPGGSPVPLVYSDSVVTTLVTNDKLDVYASYVSGTNLKVTLDAGASFKVDTSRPAFAPIAYGQLITVNDAIPKNILQKDFLSSIMKLFNLYLYEDKFDRKLIIAPYVDFYSTDPSTFIDWSGKVNRDKPMRIKPMSELNSRYYQFQFKPDSDYYSEQYRKRYNEGYGDYTFDSAFEFVSESQSAEVIFSTAVLVGYAGEDKIYPTIMKRNGTTTITEEQIDSNVRLLQTKKVLSVTSWSIKDGTTVLGSYTTYGYAGHFDSPDAPANDLNFGAPKELFFTLAAGALNVSQFNVYWSPYMAEITDKDSRLLTAYFRLTKADIYNLDFSRLVWIDGALWRLNSLKDYNATNEDCTQCSLLRVIHTKY